MRKKLIVIVLVLLGITVAAGAYLVVGEINGADVQEEEYRTVWTCGTPYIMEQYEKRQRQTFKKEPGVLTCGEYEYILLEDGTAEILNYHGRGSKVTIPVSLDGNKVAVIGENAFFHPFVTEADSEAKQKESEPGPVTIIYTEPQPSTYEGPETIVIPEGVTTIRKRAFSLCGQLVSISIPDSLTLMEEEAFDGCDRLAEIRVSPDHPVFSMAGGALIDRMNHRLIHYLRTDTAPFFEVPQGVERIGEKAFSNAQVTRLTLPDGLKEIGSGAFQGCTDLCSVVLPEGLAEIGESAFRNCRNLRSVTIPGSVDRVGDQAFCFSGLVTVTMLSGVRSFGEYAFEGCENLLSVTLPDSIESIGKGAFMRCDSLASVAIPKGVTVIEKDLFWKCTLLDSVFLPDGVTTIENGAFSYCGSLAAITLPDSTATIGDSAFSYCTSLRLMAIPERVVSIGKYAFSECENLADVMIPEGVTEIGDEVFAGCPALKAFIAGGSYAEEYCRKNTVAYICYDREE